MSSHHLPANPDLRHLKLQAKTLLKSARSGDRTAGDRIHAQHSLPLAELTLSAAQHALAREYGFESWRQLKIAVELAARTFHEKCAEFLEAAWQWGDHVRAQALLADSPEIAESSIYAAAACGRHDIVAELLRADPSKATQPGGTKHWVPLLYAAWSCFWRDREDDLVEVLRKLLDAGADPNSSWMNKQYNVAESALYGTVEANSVAGARLLLAAGADPNDNESLYHACEKWNLDLLDALGEYGLNEKDISYCVKHALDMRWPAGVRWFLDHGADPNAVHPAANETTLHWAVKRGATLDTIGALLDAGADPNARSSAGHSAFTGPQGLTPLDFAERLGSLETAALLRNRGGIATEKSLTDEFVCAASAGDRQSAEAVLAQQPDLLSRLDAHSRALVALVAQMQNWRGVRLMVELGWPVNAVGWMEARPLTWALCFGVRDMVDFLLARGASLAPAGNYFQTPVHTVVHCRWEKGDHVACLERLLEAGAPIPDGFYPCGIREFDEVLKTRVASE